MVDGRAIHVELYSVFREVVGARELEVDAAGVGTARDLLRKIITDHEGVFKERYGHLAMEAVVEQLSVLINGTPVHSLGGLDAPVRAGDRVAILEIVAGGAARVSQY